MWNIREKHNCPLAVKQLPTHKIEFNAESDLLADFVAWH